MGDNKDIFWLQEPFILLQTYLQFIPTKNMTINQQYNSITLFCIYFLILLIIFKRQLFWFYLPIITIIIIIVLYHIGEPKMKSKLSNKEKFDPIIESGYIDSTGEMRFNRVTGQPTNGEDVTYSCRKPTKDNPFMNPPISDLNTPSPEACNADDEKIQNSITKAFRRDLYMDIDDVFERMNSQRQFYTVPNTSIPNQQTEFAQWLYRVPQTCKEDQEQCLRYEDLRYKR
jgi:hypothetical protein